MAPEAAVAAPPVPEATLAVPRATSVPEATAEAINGGKKLDRESCCNPAANGGKTLDKKLRAMQNNDSSQNESLTTT